GKWQKVPSSKSMISKFIASLLCSEKRRAEAARIREKYSDRIPVRIKRCVKTPIVIVEKAERSDIPTIDKKK
ncbi:hypothetical protein C3L33_08676, partial [Rhododendron williamsianum]